MLAVISLTWRQVIGFRLSRHHLVARAPKRRLVEVVDAVGGIHAQLMSAAELSIWARTDGVTQDDIRAALWDRKTLVKTWSMRGTLHLLPAASFPTYVAALRTPRRFEKRVWLKYFGLTLDEINGIIEHVRQSLDGRMLTREDLAAAIGKHMGPKIARTLQSGWGTLLKPAAYQGVLCFGPSRGQNVVFVRPDQWLGITFDDTGADTALQSMALRYLSAYGPATHEDFSRWWGAQPAEGRRVFRSLGDEITQVMLAGKPAWLRTTDLAAVQRTRPVEAIRLLPNFDCYVLNFKPRDGFVAPRLAGRIFRKAAWISPVLLINGVAAGTWELGRRGKAAEVRLQPFSPLRPAHRKALKAEVGRLGDFLRSPVRLMS